MKTLLTRTIVGLAVAGIGLVAMPRTASADVVFQVDETVVPGTALGCLAIDCTFEADLINGFYNETLTINADFTFDVSARAIFDTYVLGATSPDHLLGTPDVFGGYGMYALFSASGSVDPLTGLITFDTTGAEVTLKLDPNSDNTYVAPGTGTGTWTVNNDAEDLQVLSSTTLLEGSGFLFPVSGGFFDLVFGNLVFTAFGNQYFPDLESLGIVFATVDGDFNEVPNPPVPGTYDVRGDLSIVYDVQQVPEPASLALLGLGLLGSGVAARRRRQRA